MRRRHVCDSDRKPCLPNIFNTLRRNFDFTVLTFAKARQQKIAPGISGGLRDGGKKRKIRPLVLKKLAHDVDPQGLKNGDLKNAPFVHPLPVFCTL
jgi:hypothetical protein